MFHVKHGAIGWVRMDKGYDRRDASRDPQVCVALLVIAEDEFLESSATIEYCLAIIGAR
jgi:hypothetical protein